MQKRFLFIALLMMALGVLAQPADEKPPVERRNDRPVKQAGGDGMRPGGGFRPPQQWTEFRGVLDRLAKENPEEAARLRELRQTNREQYIRELQALYAKQKSGPKKTVMLERKGWDLGRQYRMARTQAEKDAILEELNQLVEESFAAMIEESQERLERLKAQLDEMEANKEKINQERLKMFLEPREIEHKNVGKNAMGGKQKKRDMGENPAEVKKPVEPPEEKPAMKE